MAVREDGGLRRRVRRSLTPCTAPVSASRDRGTRIGGQPLVSMKPHCLTQPRNGRESNRVKWDGTKKEDWPRVFFVCMLESDGVVGVKKWMWF